MGARGRTDDLARERGSACGRERTTVGAGCAAGDGVQGMLVEADPDRFFRPPYVGHRGWLGVRLDRGLSVDELAGILEDAYAEVAPAKLVEAAQGS